MKDSLGRPLGTAELTYTSSDPDVASVSPTGLVIGATPGTTTITVTAPADGLTATDSVTVKVADATRVRIYASNDTYVESSTAGTNYGTLRDARQAAGQRQRRPGRPLSFDLSALAGRAVTSAVLTTENVITDSTTTPGTVRVDAHAVTGSWNETTVTYAIEADPRLDRRQLPVDPHQGDHSADLTDYVTALADNGTGSMSLGLTQDDAGTNARLVNVSTRESGKGAYLDVTLAPAPAAAVPPTYLKSVALSGLGSTLELGSTTQAKATVKDSLGNAFTRATVTYSSSSPAVASVSSTGVVPPRPRLGHDHRHRHGRRPDRDHTVAVKVADSTRSASTRRPTPTCRARPRAPTTAPPPGCSSSPS